MSLSSILEDILPTKWSSRIAEMTLVASLVAFPLPRYWPLSKLVETNKEVLLFQVLLSVLIILIGALCCLVLIVIDYRKIKNHSSQNDYNLDLMANIIEKNLSQDNTVDTLNKRIEAIQKHLKIDGISQLNELIKKLNTPDK